MKKVSPFWTIMRLFPFLIIALFMITRIGQGAEQYSTINDFHTEIQGLIDQYKITRVQTPIENVLYNHFGLGPSVRRIISSIVSYEILILCVQIMYEVIAFLPKFCISVFERKKEK